MRAALGVVLLVALTLTVPASAPAKGFTRVVLVGSDGRSVELRAKEFVLEGLLTGRGSRKQLHGGYLRLFFVGPDGFPVNPARYYPEAQCSALDWPRYETSCGRISATLVRLLWSARGLPRFHERPTVLTSITYSGRLSGAMTTVGALKAPVEMAIDRGGHRVSRRGRCYSFSGSWRGPAAATRPRRFLLCPGGIYADRHVYPLQRGVWQWFELNRN